MLGGGRPGTAGRRRGRVASETGSQHSAISAPVHTAIRLDSLQAHMWRASRSIQYPSKHRLCTESPRTGSARWLPPEKYVMFFARHQPNALHPAGHASDGGNGDVRAGSDLESQAGHKSGDAGCGPNRLNLLLSYGSWRADSWADRLPRLLEPMGIQSMRASSAREAERVIRSATIHIAIVDLGIPLNDASGPASSPSALGPDPAAEEGGTRILELLSRMPSPPPTVVVQSPRTHRDGARCMHAALRCGAFAVVDRSAAEIEMMLDILRRCVGKFYDNKWPTGFGPGSAPGSGLCT